MDKEYDLKESESVVGQLYPALIDAEGRVIDGLHRLEDDENWRVETRENIDTLYKYGVARLVANFNRRRMSSLEIERIVNDLAEVMYVEGLRAPTIGQKITTDVGWKDDSTVLRYLDDKYKMISKARERKSVGAEPTKPEPFYTLADAKNEIGEDKVDSVIAQVREELQRDPEFVIETIKKAPELLVVDDKRRVVVEGFYRPTLTKRQAEDFSKSVDDVSVQIREHSAKPRIIERKKLIESLRTLRVVKGISHNVYLPDFDSEIVVQCGEDIIDLGYAVQYVMTKLDEGYEDGKNKETDTS